jgi:hypothetical protein
MRSLGLKLVGVFAVIILVNAVIIYLVAGQAASRQFDRYVSQRARLLAESWAPLFAEYYAQSGSWQEVETLLDGASPDVSSQPGRGQGRGKGGIGQGLGPGQGMGYGWGGGAGERVLLADDQGRVVYDSEGQESGRLLSGSDLALGVPIFYDDSQV